MLLGNFLAFLAFCDIFNGFSLAWGQASLDLDEIFPSRPLDVPLAHFGKARFYSTDLVLHSLTVSAYFKLITCGGFL